jgi:hypothetical protein
MADTGNHTIRKITPAGAVSTLAGLAGIPGGTDGSATPRDFGSRKAAADPREPST